MAGALRRSNRAGMVLSKDSGNAQQCAQGLRCHRSLARGWRLVRLAALRRTISELQREQSRALDMPGGIQGVLESCDGISIEQVSRRGESKARARRRRKNAR